MKLRPWIGLLSALLLVSVAHAVRDGVTASLALGLALTTLLLLASLGLWRAGSRRKPSGHRTANRHR
jgi:4-amino-4-deoxy-L-arabinose transferase-like glycosyltransferase